jgi:hypothetical protein
MGDDDNAAGRRLGPARLPIPLHCAAEDLRDTA